jgi:hypothetical protein
MAAQQLAYGSSQGVRYHWSPSLPAVLRRTQLLNFRAGLHWQNEFIFTNSLASDA